MLVVRLNGTAPLEEYSKGFNAVSFLISSFLKGVGRHSTPTAQDTVKEISEKVKERSVHLEKLLFLRRRNFMQLELITQKLQHIISKAVLIHAAIVKMGGV